MARTYQARFGNGVMFSNENTVGIGMKNDRTDVVLIQYILKAVMTANKIFLAGNTRFTPPPGPQLNVSGVWDEASKNYLARWEALISEARAYWAHGRVDPTLYPGTVVPYRLGGKKIIALNEMGREFFGEENFARLTLSGGTLPAETWNELFFDSVTWRQHAD